MTIEIDAQLQRLIEAHPLLFRGQAPYIPSHVPEGWYALIDKLCSDLEALLGPEACAGFQVEQIKEKFGTLRFYYRLGEREDLHVDVISPDAIKHIVNFPPEAAEQVEAVEDRVRALVTAACQASESTCMTCSAPAQLRNIGGYVTVRCDQHYAERVALHEARRRD